MNPSGSVNKVLFVMAYLSKTDNMVDNIIFLVHVIVFQISEYKACTDNSKLTKLVELIVYSYQ